MKLDLHVHTYHSGNTTIYPLSLIMKESYNSPEGVYRRAKARGMDLVTITDHDRIDGALTIADRPDVLVGCEVTGCFPNDGVRVHLGALGITETQHLEIQRLRTDVRELLPYLKQEQDLFYRLNVIHVQVPPLRERLDDVPALLECFCDRFCGQYAARPPVLTGEARALLTSYQWPGNVRELQNLVERLVVTSAGESVDTRRLAALIDGERPAVDRPVRDGTRGPDPGHAAGAAEALFNRIVLSGESFWSVAHDPFMARDLTRQQLTELVQRGLSSTDGSYRQLASLFRVSSRDLRRFTGFLKRYGRGTAPRELRATA